MTSYRICCYMGLQFLGYLIQILPLLFLFYAPYPKEILRFSKKRILLCLTIFYVAMSAGAAILLGEITWREMGMAKTTWIANVIFFIDILVGTVVYFNSFREKVSGKYLFYTCVLEYGIALYILNEIGGRFIEIPFDNHYPYGVSTIVIYGVCTASTFPFVYYFLRKFGIRGLEQGNRKSLCMITVCSVIIVLLTIAALQMGVGLRSFRGKEEAKIYESILLLCILAANVISYIIYFFCMILEQEKEKMESRVIAYEMQYKNFHEGIEKERRMYHNLRHHFRTMSVLAANGHIDELQEYIGGYLENLDHVELRSLSYNPVIDSVISYYIRQAELAGIRVNCDIQVKKDYLFDIKDMTVLIGNAMENALKACEEKRKDAYIDFAMKQYRQSILIKVENKIYLEKVPQRTIQFGRKRYGLASIELVARKYEGSVEAWQEGDVFILRVVLNMPDDRRKL